MNNNPEVFYPISKIKTIRGNRHLVREKVLQILYAYYICEGELDSLLTHIFEREFNFEDELPESQDSSSNNNNYDKIFHPDEVTEMDADVQIIWSNDERNFGKELLTKVVSNKDYLDNLIDTLVENWDKSRIAPIDRILIQMAVTEFLFFPEIPIKVSMDEVLDISKAFSTDKSSNFINGVLDTIFENLKVQNRIQKTGRGLKQESK